MYRKFILLIASSILCVSLPTPLLKHEVASLEGNVKFVDDIETFKEQNPNALFFPMEINSDPEIGFRYVLGRRVAGDRLVAHGSDSFKYSTLKDVQVQLTYPSSGIGAIITYLEILVQQSSNLGKAYVVAGGIGQRYISIIVQAHATTYMSYVVSFYGM